MSWMHKFSSSKNRHLKHVLSLRMPVYTIAILKIPVNNHQQ